MYGIASISPERYFLYNNLFDLHSISEHRGPQYIASGAACGLPLPCGIEKCALLDIKREVTARGIEDLAVLCSWRGGDLALICRLKIIHFR